MTDRLIYRCPFLPGERTEHIVSEIPLLRFFSNADLDPLEFVRTQIRNDIFDSVMASGTSLLRIRI